MKKMLVVLLVLMIGITGVLLNGCAQTQTLSRTKAKDIITKSFGFPIPVSGNLGIGESNSMNKDDLNLKDLAAFAKEGLLIYTYQEGGTVEKPGQILYTFVPHAVNVSLTEKGKQLVVGDVQTWGWPRTGQKYVNVKLGEEQFVEITGISLAEGNKEAAVEFTWRYGGLTPFGKQRKYVKSFEEIKVDQPYPATAYLKLYDDGWRVVEGGEGL